MPLNPKLRSALIGIIAEIGAIIALTFAAHFDLAADKGGPKNSLFDEAALAPAKSWSGIWAGTNLGYAIATANGEACGIFSCDNINGQTTAVTFGGSAGVDIQAGKHFVFGIFGDYDFLFNEKPKTDADGLWA